MTEGWRPRVRTAGPSQPLDELAVLWLDDYAAGRPRGGARDTYELHVNTHFVPFFENKASRITTDAIVDYQTARLKVVLRKTLAKELTTLRTFLAWLERKGVIVKAPVVPPIPKGATGVRDPVRGKRRPAKHAPEDVTRLLEALPETTRARRGKGVRIVVRDYFAFLYETSLRPATVQAISVPEHWSKGEGRLLITDDIDKARFGRWLPLTPRALELLERHAPAEGPVFGVHDLRAVLKRTLRGLGIGGTAYDLRHARITHWLEEGASLPGAAYLAGHKLVTTTNKYVKPAERAATAALDETSKRRRKRGPGDH